MHNDSKTVKKSSHWWKHGKHKGTLGIIIQNRRVQKEAKKSKSKMYNSVSELIKTEHPKRNKKNPR